MPATDQVPDEVHTRLGRLVPAAVADRTIRQALKHLWCGWDLLLADHTTTHPYGYVAVFREARADRPRWAAVLLNETDATWQPRTPCRRAAALREVVVEREGDAPVVASDLPGLLEAVQGRVRRIDSPWLLAALWLLSPGTIAVPAYHRPDPAAADLDGARLLLGLGCYPRLESTMARYVDLHRHAHRSRRTQHAGQPPTSGTVYIAP